MSTQPPSRMPKSWLWRLFRLEEVLGIELMGACEEGDIRATNSLLTGTQASVDWQDDSGDAPLHKASGLGKTDVVSCLLKHKANINIINKENHTPLIRAAVANKMDTVRLLIGARANARFRGGMEGRTARDMAKSKGNHAVAEYLA